MLSGDLVSCPGPFACLFKLSHYIKARWRPTVSRALIGASLPSNQSYLWFSVAHVLISQIPFIKFNSRRLSTNTISNLPLCTAPILQAWVTQQIQSKYSNNLKWKLCFKLRAKYLNYFNLGCYSK